MTRWLLSFGWNWALLPVAAYFLRAFWLATRERTLKYLQHTRVTQRKPVKLSVADRSLIEKWHRHCEYRSLEPIEPPQPGGDLSRDSWLLDLIRMESMFPWRKQRETWLVGEYFSVRESDGTHEDGDLHKRLLGMVAVAEARRIEIEDLTK